MKLPLLKCHLGVSWHALLCTDYKSKTQRAHITGQGHTTKEKEADGEWVLVSLKVQVSKERWMRQAVSPYSMFYMKQHAAVWGRKQHMA